MMTGSFGRSEIKAATLFSRIDARTSSNTIVPEHCNSHAHYLEPPTSPYMALFDVVRTWLARFFLGEDPR